MSTGHAAVLAGSCSRATLAQLGVARSHVPVWQLDPLATPDAAQLAAAALAWARDKLGNTPIVIAASAPPDKVAALQAKLGRDAAGALIEAALAQIAEGIVANGVRRLVVAGGETAGAVVQRAGRAAACASAPRSIPACPGPMREGRRRAPAAGAEVGQFRRAGLLPEGVRDAGGVR